ncbi:MAG TPA: ISL3 family transposase [Herpetosiphonaceae bacterium]|nr:ISL3 family transposase [Herpetosiphonaceae bacterium]
MSTSISLSTLLAILLPTSAHLHVDALEFDATAPTLNLTVTSIQSALRCPHCHQAATRVHSRYVRTLADLPWAHLPVRLQLQVRTLFCGTPTCPRRIFTERLPSLVAPWARRTTRLADRQRHTGLAVGGAAGARLNSHLAQPASRNTVLSLIRTTPESDHPTPRVLGVDDWSQRKGHSYRTILVDLERQRPIDLVPDREATSLIQWLAAHPGVEIICRDRAGAYAEGATNGAPTAIQVADRFHLLQNLHATLTRVLEQHAATLTPQATTDPSTPLAGTDPSADAQPQPAAPVRVVPPETPSAAIQEQAQQRRARRLARYEQVWQLRQAGWSGRAIAEQVGLNRNTVQKYLTAAAFPERHPRAPRASVLDPFKPYILQRWNEGCHTGTTLWHEVEQQGYRGKRSTVYSYISRLRRAQGLPGKRRSSVTAGTVVANAPRLATPRSLAWAVVRRPDKRDQTDQQRIAAVCERHPVVAEAVALTEAFASFVRERRADQLDGWLEQASGSAAVAFRNFAASLRRDYAAVQAGMSLTWSSGQVEGQINRLKMIKRTMYGRAKLDLLRKRVLYAA